MDANKLCHERGGSLPILNKYALPPDQKVQPLDFDSFIYAVEPYVNISSLSFGDVTFIGLQRKVMFLTICKSIHMWPMNCITQFEY